MAQILVPAGGSPIFKSGSSSSALNTSFKILKADGTPADSENMPQAGVRLLSATLYLDTIAGGATTVTWFLARDANGDEPITPAQTDTIQTGATTATDGSVSRSVGPGLGYLPAANGEIYVIAKLDAGTANGTPEVIWVT